MSDATVSADASHAGTTASERTRRIIARELRTVVRTRTFLLLGVVLAAAFIALAWVGGGARAGYVPTVVDLVTPIELLVPVVAIAFGYRAILASGKRGELAVLETYPLTPRELVAGVYVGRAIGLIAAIVAPLAVVGGLVVIAREDPFGRYASHTGADSPLLFIRFIAVTVLFALVVLAIALAISALASTTRSVLALAVVSLITLLVGLDLAILYGLEAGIISEAILTHSLAVSPLSAYRGLVFETVIVTAAGTGPQTATVSTSILGLLAWGVGALVTTVWAVSN